MNENPAARGLPLHEAEALALANNPALGRLAALVDAARGRFVQAGLYPNPLLGYHGGEMGNNGRAGQQGGFVEQEFVTGGKLKLAREVARRDVALAHQRFDAGRFRVLSDVRVAFYAALVAQRRVVVSEQLRDIGTKALTTAKDLFGGGEVSQADVLRAQIELDVIRNDLARANASHNASLRTLAGVMGTPTLALDRVSGNLKETWPPYDWHAALQRLLTESPQMAAAALRVERARWALSRARAQPIPNVTVQATVQQDTATEDTIAGLQASIPIPVFNRNQGNIQAARSELMAAQRDVRRVALSLQNQLATVFAQFDAGRRQADRYQRDILKNSKESLRLITTGYEEGEFKYTDLLTAQRTYVRAELAYLEAVREARTAAAKIEGLLLTGSLQLED